MLLVAISILSGTFMLSFAVCLSYICFIAFRSYHPCNLSFASVYLFVSVPETTGYDLGQLPSTTFK